MDVKEAEDKVDLKKDGEMHLSSVFAIHCSLSLSYVKTYFRLPLPDVKCILGFRIHLWLDVIRNASFAEDSNDNCMD